MTLKPEILLEGSYLYYQNDINYCQENFKLTHLVEQGQYVVNSEISSRVETGEFLKFIVHYEMTNHFIPYYVQVQKSIGAKYSCETFKYDQHHQELHYSFQSGDATQEIKRPHNAKHHLTSPSFATAAMFTLSKKMEVTGRTAVVVVSSSNEWNYEGPPTDKIIYTEFKSRELSDYKLNNTTLPASHLCLYEHDSSFSTAMVAPTDLYLSKHFAIPYQLVQGDMRIDIQNLKKHS